MKQPDPPTDHHQTQPGPALETWTPPMLEKLPVAETANTGSQNGDDGVFFS